MRPLEATPPHLRPRIVRYAVELVHFGIKNARACLFPVFIFAMLGASQIVPLPMARYDFLLIACLGMQAFMVAAGLETRDELKVITLFHLLGLGLELFKVHMGSWSYPEDAVTKVAGVPLFSGFMYASVASFMIQAWRLLRLRFLGWPSARVVVPLGGLIYLNFFTHHFVLDLHYALVTAVLVVFGRTWVAFRPADVERRIPLVLAFLLIGMFVWFAENIATYLGAWQYPDQEDGWRLVGIGKLSSWALLVIVSMLAVVQLKRVKGTRPGESQDVVVGRAQRDETPRD